MSGSPPDGIERPAGRYALRALERSVLGGILVMIPGTLGYLTDNLWLFPSLGPSLVLMVVLPHNKTSRAYNTFAGQLLGIVCGFAAALATGATGGPSALAGGHLLAPHVAAAGLAVMMMILLQLLFRAIHPPGSSTAIMIALGVFGPTWHDFMVIFIGVVITTIAGEAARLFLIRGEREVA